MVVFRQKWLNNKNVAVLGQKKLSSGKSGFIRAKVDVFGQGSCIRAEVVVFEKK